MTQADLQRMYSSKRSQLLEQSLTVLEAELDWRKQNDRFEFYEPNEPVEKLVKLVGTQNNLLYVLSAANGIGKTTALVNIAASLIFGPRNKYFDFPIFKNWPYPKRLRFVSEPAQIEEGGVLPTEIAKWWPRDCYQTFKDSKHYISRYQAGDWVLEVRTYEQSQRQHEGDNLGLILFNEPPPEHLWTPNVSRLRLGGLIIVGMTPLTEAGWFFDKVVPRHTDYVVYAGVESACKTHGVRGHLDHDQIQKMIDEYSDDEKEARIDGKAMYLKGVIFKDFNPQVHVLKKPVQAPMGATIYHVIDPHTDKPFAMIWAYVDGRGNVTIVDEWPNVDFYKWHNCNLSIPDYLNIFRDKENGMKVHKRIIDRHFAEISHLSGMTRKTLRDEFQEKGIYFEPSYQAAEEVETGITKVREYLRYNPERPVDNINSPKLFLNPHCFNTIKSLGRWARDPKSGKVQESFKDFCDVARYLVMANPKIDTPIPYREPKRMWG